ncbi:unnamed protein product, partial [Mesorhabditis spiculigera]
MDLSDLEQFCPRSIGPDDPYYNTTPFNHACLTNFLNELQGSLRRYSPWEAIAYTSVYVIISVLAVIGNGLVILAICRKKSMRTNRNVLILNLAISNLILALTNIPLLWLPSMDFEFPYSSLFCKVANALPGSNIYCSTLTISVMAIDRYYSVKRLSLMSTSRKQWIKAILLSALIWVFALILSLPLLLAYDISMLLVIQDVPVITDNGTEAIQSYGWRQCQITSGTNSDSVQALMSVMQAAFLYVIPLIVLSIFNVKLTRFLKHNANQMSRNRLNRSRDLLQAESERSCGDRSPECLTPTSKKLPKPRPGTAERASEKRRSRTTGLLVAMAGSYAILWLPFTVVTMLIDLGILHGSSNEQTDLIENIDQSCKVLSMLSICVNPFLYGFLNTNFRQEFTEIYYNWLRCMPRPPARYTSGVAMEYSSVAYPNRMKRSVQAHRNTVLKCYSMSPNLPHGHVKNPSLRQSLILESQRMFNSLRHSFRSMRSSFRAEQAIGSRDRRHSKSPIDRSIEKNLRPVQFLTPTRSTRITTIEISDAPKEDL